MLSVSQGLVVAAAVSPDPLPPSPPWLPWTEPGKCGNYQPVFSKPPTTFKMVDIIPVLQTVKLSSLLNLSVLVWVLQRNRTNRVCINAVHRKVFIIRPGLM